MNDGKLCGLVVLLCVICPILVGYAWPVGTDTGIAYETGDPANITADSINTKIPVFVPYNDPFNNNQNVFEDFLYSNTPEMVTGNPGPIWSNLNPEPHTQSVTTDAYGFYTINDVATWENWGTAISVIFPLLDWDEIDMDDGGNVADLVIYYPKTDKMFFRSINSDYFLPVESHKITFSGPANSVEDVGYVLYFDEGYYADLSYGMQVPWYTSDWFNGYENKGANILFSTVNNSQQIDLVLLDQTEYHDTHIQIRVDSGTIKMRVYDNSTLYYSEELGSNSVYDKVLLTIDYDSATIALSGLRGLTSYIGDYNAAIRQTIKAEWENPIIFRSFTIDRYSGSDAVWYVADTLSGVAETDGSHNYYMDLRQYTASGSCQLNIRSVVQHGDRINFVINGVSHYGTIEKGILSVTGSTGLIEVPINNLLIGLIANSFYINGQELAQYSSITEAKIYFYDDWKMSLYYYPVTEVTVKTFTWLPGGFGLDIMGFCSVGLITSVGSALGLGLYGRRSGMRIGLVTMTALFCAAAYLIFMMNGGI